MNNRQSRVVDMVLGAIVITMVAFVGCKMGIEAGRPEYPIYEPPVIDSRDWPTYDSITPEGDEMTYTNEFAMNVHDVMTDHFDGKIDLATADELCFCLGDI